MAHIHEALYARLAAFPGLTALLTSGSTVRLYHGTMPQTPAGQAVPDTVVLNCFTPRHIADFQGQGGLGFTILQADTFSTNANRLAAMAKQIRLGIQGMPAGTYAGVYIHSGRALDDVPWGWDADAQIYRITSQFEICHNEEQPTPA